MASWRKTCLCRYALLCSTAAVYIGCSEPGGPGGDDTDTIPPMVSIAFPDASGYDQNGDAFVDVIVQWTDQGGIDASSAQVRIVGESTTSTQLSNWDVVDQTQQGLRQRETL